MKNIAFWSRDHKVSARIMIALCHLMIFCIGCYVGLGLQKKGIFLSPATFWTSVTLFLVIIFLVSRSYHSFSFYRKKFLDGLILICGFVMIVCFVDQKNVVRVASYNRLYGSFSTGDAKVSNPKSKPSVREVKKQLKELKKALKEDGASTGGIILAILVATALGILLAAASCSLSCNGQGGLAVLLFVGGITAIFFICRAILRGTRKKSKDKVTAGPNLQPDPLSN